MFSAATGFYRKMTRLWKIWRVISYGHHFLRNGCIIWNRKARSSIQPKPATDTDPGMAGQARHSPLWNGWRPCARIFPTEASRWYVTMAITATSRGETERNRNRRCPPLHSRTGGTFKNLKKNWARLIQKIYEVDPLVCPHL